ncbi:MAG: hypothetical protein E6H89_04770 [Chloroflexi bacterium]|nr:MAG: hypothetical protein E6H89_04770 [Chloroflexota bacterium]
MAGALRPVVLLMLFASVLFVVDGFLDGVYPGGPAWFTGKYDNLAEIAYLFAILNTVVAIMVARGSERSLQSRIGLSVFFLVERPVTAFALGPKPIESVITHFATAGVELLILVTALRVWRLGNAAPDVDTLFSLEGPSPTSAKPEQDADATRRGTGAVASRNAWLIGGVTVALALALVADGLYEGYVPGGRAWTTSSEGSGWIVYVFAAVALAVAARAVHGGRVALRALIVIALILFVERSFTPFSMREQDPIVLALHAVGAFVSLAVALVTASVIRGGPTRHRASVRKLEAA